MLPNIHLSNTRLVDLLCRPNRISLLRHLKNNLKDDPSQPKKVVDQSTKVHLGVNLRLILKKASVTLHPQSIESCQGDTTQHLTLLPVQFSQYQIITTSNCLRNSLSLVSNLNHKVRLMTRQLLPQRHMLVPVLIILRRPKSDYRLRN